MAFDEILTSDPVSAYRERINEVLGVVNQAAQFLSGVVGSRPAANSVDPGTFYFATDTGDLSMSDGSTWNFVSDSDYPGTYRTIHEAAGTGSATNGRKYGMTSAGVFENVGAALSASRVLDIFHFEAASYEIDSHDTKLRLQAQLHGILSAQAITYTAALYPVTAVDVQSGVRAYTVGAAVDGSGIALLGGVDGFTDGDSGDFDPPADGYYVLGYSTGATVPNAGIDVALSLQLQLHHV